MNNHIRHITRVSLLMALAIIIHTVEGFLPITVVWFRFGFANIITCAVLILYGFKDAVIVTIGRVFIGSLLAGSFGSPGFILSLSGGVFAILAMQFAKFCGPKIFSELGISVNGAVFHNLAQLVAAYLIVVKNEAIFLLLPAMLLTALGTGILNGIAAGILIDALKKADINRN